MIVVNNNIVDFAFNDFAMHGWQCIGCPYRKGKRTSNEAKQVAAGHLHLSSQLAEELFAPLTPQQLAAPGHLGHMYCRTSNNDDDDGRGGADSGEGGERFLHLLHIVSVIRSANDAAKIAANAAAAAAAGGGGEGLVVPGVPVRFSAGHLLA